MPMYEYVCRKCETKFEKLVRSMTSKAAVPCPECGSKQTARLLSSFSVGGEPTPRAASASHGPSCACCSGGGGQGQCPMGGF